MSNSNKNDERRSRWSSTAIVTCTIIAAVGIVWYNIYTTNRRGLQLEHIEQRRRATMEALDMNPHRFQMLTDGGYEADRKTAIVARLM